MHEDTTAERGQRWRMELSVREVRGEDVQALVPLLLLADQARRRGKRRLTVGTGNSSLGTIAVYQKCGVRMDHVRPDYLWYFPEPSFEHGIQKRDLLVSRLDLADAGASPHA